MRRRGGTLTAHPLGLGVLGFYGFILASFGLSFGRLPAPDLAEAFGDLAIMLVPAPWQVLLPAAFAQANPGPRSSWTGTPTAIWTIIIATHGSDFSQGPAWGERSNVLLGRRLSKRKKEHTGQSILPCTNQTVKKTV